MKNYKADWKTGRCGETLKLIFVSGKLDLPLSTTATLVTINAGTGLFSSLLAGSLADKTGRKIIMVASMTLTALAYIFMLRANSYPAFAALMFLIGLSNPLYQVGADAMLADLIPEKQRVDAYAINRIAVNTGFAFGPAIGGFVAAKSYDLAFYAAATGMLLHGLLLLLLAHETLDKSLSKTHSQGADVRLCAIFCHPPHAPRTCAVGHSDRYAHLCVGNRLGGADDRFLGLLVEHGHLDTRGTDARTHLQQICGRPRASRPARTLHERLLAGMGAGARRCADYRRLLERRHFTHCYLVWWDDNRPGQRPWAVSADAARIASISSSLLLTPSHSESRML